MIQDTAAQPLLINELKASLLGMYKSIVNISMYNYAKYASNGLCIS
jgi:hypothetical protein